MNTINIINKKISDMNNSNEKTIRNGYSAPTTTVVLVETESLLADSGKITGTVEDFKGWGNQGNDAKENSVSLWDGEED